MADGLEHRPAEGLQRAEHLVRHLRMLLHALKAVHPQPRTLVEEAVGNGQQAQVVQLAGQGQTSAGGVVQPQPTPQQAAQLRHALAVALVVGVAGLDEVHDAPQDVHVVLLGLAGRLAGAGAGVVEPEQAVVDPQHRPPGQQDHGCAQAQARPRDGLDGQGRGRGGDGQQQQPHRAQDFPKARTGAGVGGDQDRPPPAMVPTRGPDHREA